MLEFEKEGFNSGRFPLEITSRDTSRGSVSYELGSAAHDTIELRDGSVLCGRFGFNQRHASTGTHREYTKF
jgi:hypothetical protein